jgi:hypothetical protein
LNAAARLLASLALVFAAGLAARAQHGGHDMQNMPGMDMSKPKAKARTKRKTKAKPRPSARRKTVARPAAKKHDMSGMDMSAPMRMPSRSQTPSQPATPSPAPAKTSMENMPGMSMPATSATPAHSASPQQTHAHDMPGMQMPSMSATPATTTPQAAPSPEHKMDMHAPMDMPMNNASPQASPSPTASPQTSGGMDMSGMKHEGHEAMPGMKMEGGMTGVSETDVDELMVMSGEDMGIRVGASKTNFVPMGQMGSGTSWQPAASPMNMIHRRAGDWLLMFHYDVKLGVNRQGGPRGVTKFESQNWFMPMAYRRVGVGTLQLRGMFSVEPFTFPPGGSPLLFQTGETYKGQPLIDRQHPHDLFMELSAQYQVPLGERATWFAYFGYPGEPALGPVAFMHRASASENPSATLAHHLQDSTHIAFGVFTSGFTYRWFKVEGSIFNGREPDENRYDFDAHKWNSRSTRLTFAPSRNWTMQVSYGFLRSPEAQEPDADVRRATASVQYVKPFSRGTWATAFVWGRNHVSEHGETRNLNGYTFESTVNFIDKNYIYTRLELVDKDELLRPSDRALLGITSDHPSFRIGAYTFGYVRDVFDNDDWSIGLGGDVTSYSKPDALDAIYGARPTSFKIFLRFRPGRMKMDHTTHGEHDGHDTGMKHEQ